MRGVTSVRGFGAIQSLETSHRRQMDIGLIVAWILVANSTAILVGYEPSKARTKNSKPVHSPTLCLGSESKPHAECRESTKTLASGLRQIPAKLLRRHSSKREEHDAVSPETPSVDAVNVLHTLNEHAACAECTLLPASAAALRRSPGPCPKIRSRTPAPFRRRSADSNDPPRN